MLTAAECLEIIKAAYPDLRIRSYVFNDKGQNNDVLIINEEIVFRFPRTSQAARRLRVEAAILGHLQGRVTLRIPNPIYLRLDGDQGPRPGHRRLSVASSAVDRTDRLEAPPSPIIGRAPIAGRATVARRAAASQATALGGGRTAADQATLPSAPIPSSSRPVGSLLWEEGLGGKMPWQHESPGGPPRKPGPEDRGDLRRGGGLGGRLPWEKEREERETREREERERGRRRARRPRGVFMGYRWIPGEQLWREIMLATDDQQVVQTWADQLGNFLRELHSTPIQGDLAGFLRPYDRQARWADFFQRVRDKVFPHMRPDARTDVARRFEAFLGDPRNFEYPLTLVHGDFGPSNILLDPQSRRLTGVIDFGSAGLDDPAIDLAALIGPYGYGEPFLRRFGRTYPIEPATLERARFYASTFALQDAVFGIENGDVEAFNFGIAAYK